MSLLSEGDNWCEKADIIVATPSLSEPNAIRQLLYRESFVLSMRADHPYAKEDMTLERFCELDHVIVSPRSTSFSGPIDDALKQMGLKRRVMVSVPVSPSRFKPFAKRIWLRPCRQGWCAGAQTNSLLSLFLSRARNLKSSRPGIQRCEMTRATSGCGPGLQSFPGGVSRKKSVSGIDRSCLYGTGSCG